MAIGAGQVTRFGIGGGIWRPVGDFSTKEEGTPVVPVDVEQPTGGFWQWYDYEQTRKDDERKKRKADKLAAQNIEGELDRALALAERDIEEEDARRAELARLNRLVSKNQDFINSIKNERLELVVKESLEEQTFSKMERMERELRNMREEELFLMEAVLILVNQ